MPAVNNPKPNLTRTVESSRDWRSAAALCALLALAAGPVRAQQANPPSVAAAVAAQTSDQNANPNAPATSASANGGGTNQTIVLTPFEVSTTKEQGYFTPNTLAGTRLNNNIADIPSSVTVVTQQELLDTNSTNINDIFRYQANTEGASTYTPVTMVRSNVADVLGTQNALVSGNRVRGLNSADLEVDDYFSSPRLPFDSYNTQSVEIDRGPNSILFGTGSPAGIVNDSRTQAQLNLNSGNVSLEGASWGTYRQTAGFNVSVIPDVLALYIAQMYNSQGYEQKPSGDITRREYAAFTLVPFKNHKTQIRGSFEYYNDNDNQPNFLTPVDFVTPWIASGRPVYDPQTDMVTFLSTGKTMGPYAAGTTYPNYVGILQSQMTVSTSPYFVPSLAYASSGHYIMGLDSTGTMDYFYKGQQSGYSVQTIPSPMTASQALVNEQEFTESVNLPNPAAYQIWQPPSVTSDGIYNWQTINIDASSRMLTDAKTYYLDFQQEILPNLNFDAGWFRQEIWQWQDEPFSQANATTVYVDTNEYLPNGAANPHVGSPFIDAYQSDEFEEPENNNNLRASLEYELNTKDFLPNWLGDILGHHRLMAVVSQHDDVQWAYRYRESFIGGDANYLPTSATLNASTGYGYGNSNNAIEQWYYLNGATALPTGYGATAPARVAQPGIFTPSYYPITSYNYSTGTWYQSTMTAQSILYPTGGESEDVQNQKTYFWEPFLWSDRIVGTLGINDDQVKNRLNVFPNIAHPLTLEYTNGFPNPVYWNNMGPYSYVGGNTETEGFVVHPFMHWDAIDNAAAQGNLLAGFARTISFTFNKSDNFNAPPAFYTDFNGNPLPKPQGTEKDYGIEIATPNNKLFLRATWFTTENENQLVSNTSNARALYIDETELKDWATAVVEVRTAEAGITNAAGTPYPMPNDPSNNFGNQNVFPITATMQSQISALTGLPYTFGGNVGANGQFINPYETEDGIAKGTEVEAEYNPTPEWRMKFSWGYQKTILSNIAQQAASYVNSRLAAWQAYTAPDLTQIYTNNGNGGRAMSLSNFWTGYGYDTNVYQGNSNGWYTTQDYYNIVVAGQLATDTALNGTQATNQRDYTWSYLTTYDFDHGPLKGWEIGGALRYLGTAIAGYYGNTNVLSPSGQIFEPNTAEPIYFPAEYHLDAWLGYQFVLPWSDGRIKGQVQLNGTDLNIHGYLQPVTYNYDGSPAAERIIQPTQWSVTTRFFF